MRMLRNAVRTRKKKTEKDKDTRHEIEEADTGE